MKARFPGRCPVCCRPIRVGQDLMRHEESWAHQECAQAVLQDNRARTRILEGVEFRGQKPSVFRIGASPSTRVSRRFTGGRKRGHTRGIRKIA